VGFVNERSNNATSLPQLTALLDKVLLSGLPESASHIMLRVQDVAAVASDVSHLMEALPPLVSVLRYGNVRKTDSDSVGQVVEGLCRTHLRWLARRMLYARRRCRSSNVCSHCRHIRIGFACKAMTTPQNGEKLCRALANRDGLHG